MATTQITVSRNFTTLVGLVEVPAEDMREIGLLMRERITRRTIAGLDADGAPFAPYSAAYALQKERALGGVFGHTGYGHVNLTVSGNMLNHLQITSVEPNKVTLGWVQ